MNSLSKLNRSFMKSLLRWTRSNLASKVPFVIKTSTLPPRVLAHIPNHVQQICNSFGVRHAIVEAFRSKVVLPKDPEGDAMEALRVLNGTCSARYYVELFVFAENYRFNLIFLNLRRICHRTPKMCEFSREKGVF